MLILIFNYSTVFIGNNAINRVSETDFLVVIIDDNPNRHNHIGLNDASRTFI